MSLPAQPTSNTAQGCPAHFAGTRQPLRFEEELVFPLNKRVVAQYARNDENRTELRLFYGDREISFDEPELFEFGEMLGTQARFVAGGATSWGGGYRWETVRPLLEQLIDEGILRRATQADASPRPRGDGARPAPLPPGPAHAARAWSEGASLFGELVGRSFEHGHLEMVIPVFRVAHIALDSEGRQVGESNVFPKALRLDVPTRWRQCIYAGTRHQVDRPMNVSALKSMRQHWPQMMKALAVIRRAYLARFPDARTCWTVGHLERLATVVLAVPTYALEKRPHPVPNGELHPALSSLFRVTDGLRMTMHQMLFVPIGEPTLSPDTPMGSEEILAYAERNYSFHSEHGVCAGPRAMIEEFLKVVVDGALAPEHDQVALDPAVDAALADLDAAFDYAMHGLQVYAAVFSLWPAMTRAYETMLSVMEAWDTRDASIAVIALRERLRDRVDAVKQATFLATEAWRVDRERVFADMFGRCGQGVRHPEPSAPLSALVAPRHDSRAEAFSAALGHRLALHFGRSAESAGVAALTDCVTEFVLRQQAILAVASDRQAKINSLLGRTPPTRLASAGDLDIHNLLQGADSRRLPFLNDELQQVFDIEIHVDRDGMTLVHTHSDALPVGQ